MAQIGTGALSNIRRRLPLPHLHLSNMAIELLLHIVEPFLEGGG